MFAQSPILVLNHLLAGAHWARKRLEPFAGNRARIEMAPFVVMLEVTEDGYFVAADGEDAEVRFTLPPNSPFLVLQGLDAVIREAHVSGPADFADNLGFVLKNLRWDAEEDLARLFGDVAAHRLGSLARGFLGWQRQAANNAASNVTEYLREEKQILPRKEDLARWQAETSRLNEDLIMLEARVAALDRRQ